MKFHEKLVFFMNYDYPMFTVRILKLGRDEFRILMNETHVHETWNDTSDSSANIVSIPVVETCLLGTLNLERSIHVATGKQYLLPYFTLISFKFCILCLICSALGSWSAVCSSLILFTESYNVWNGKTGSSSHAAHYFYSYL